MNIEKLDISSMIYEIRGKQVMLDSDLAKLCNIETKSLKRQVNRNKERFPMAFCFKLTKEEYYKILRRQNGTLELEQGKYSKYLPYVFTEQGVAMLATILKTKVATKVSIDIMDAFVAMRYLIKSNLLDQKYINNIVLENREKLKEIKDDVKLLQEAFDKLEEKEIKNKIYFNGEIYDAYSNILNIFKEAKSKLVIIDSYADNTILDIVRRLETEVILITKKDNLLTKQDIEKYSKQYNNLSVIYNNTFHDRYFILDNEIIYHCGASINRIGYRTFSINIINDKEIIDLLINKISKLIE